MIHQYVQKIAGRAGKRGSIPNLNHMNGRLNLGFLKATLVTAAVLAGLSI